MNLVIENYNKLYNIYLNITNNQSKNEILASNIKDFEIEKKNFESLIKLYKTTNENKYLKEAIELHKEKLSNLSENIMNLMYSHINVESDDNEIKYLIQKSYYENDFLIEKKNK